MQYNTLKDTPLQQIIDCLLSAFEGYYVPMPTDLAYWQQRFEKAGVDQAHSWGVFDREKLVGFIINAIGEHDGQHTAFNTGTGVLKDYRGQKIVDHLYQFGLPGLKAKGIEGCTLEVITKNLRAIRVYERIGFSISHRLKCYQGNLTLGKKAVLKERHLAELEGQFADHHYSWDYKKRPIQKAEVAYKVFEVFDAPTSSPAGYFIINPSNGTIAQLETKTKNWPLLFDGISQVCSEIRIINIHENRIGLLNYLQASPLQNHLDQFAMEMSLSN